jgi:N-acetylated-alpha-linked acidic dipeptidase
MSRRAPLAAALLAAGALAASYPAAAQAQAAAPRAADPLPGYAPAAAARERALEAAAIARPAPDSAARHARALSREPHVAGTEAQARTRDYVIAEMRRLGLATETRAYEVYLPHATQVRAWRLGAGAGDSTELQLAEPPVAGDSTSAMAQYPTVNGSSAAGDVSGEVVYVNYGLIEDYARLDSLGVSVRGKVAVARYGRSFRGIKAREAEKHGAAALMIYSDPADDGYARGDVYPEGPMRPAGGVQRGSVFNGDGDPSTPGYPSVKGARRVPVDSMGVPRIPVIPLSYGNAAELLRDLRGTPIPPSGWQGGLPFRYHVGPGPVRARVRVATDVATRAYKTIWNTYGTIRGTDFPDEIVMVGGHRDGWGPGAADNVSGIVSVLESARAITAEAKAGRRPRRTVVFATWDAEEWGLIGSTEYVEQDSLRLTRGAVAYFNQDVAAQGPQFGAGGSPSLRSTVRSVARLVDDPGAGTSVYGAWRAREKTPADSEPAFDDPGGGSDFAPFYNHLGIPIADWSFGGAGGVYHSAYDSYNWMTKFGDPGFRYHAVAARVGTALVRRMANADVLPYDYAEYARTMRAYLPPIDSAARARALAGVSTAPIAAALDRFEQAAQRFAARRDAALARDLPGATLKRTNAALLKVERALTRPEGLRTRPWNRNLIYAADEDNGYANIPLPSVTEAVRAGDAALTQREVTDLAGRFDRASQALAEAEAALR